MKEKIYTIPINDAFDKHSECAVCEFEKQQEKLRIEYTLGASMMEPDSRIFTNNRGFCEHHTSMLLSQENKLSFSLVLKTHIDELIEQFEQLDVALNEQQKQKLFAKNKADTIDLLEQAVASRHNSCAVCEKLGEIMDSFTDNLIYLYFAEDEFRQKFNSSNGFCLKHYCLLVKGAKKHLKGQKLKDFCINLNKLEIENFRRVRDDVDWFAKKFDYRYKDQDWKNSRDSVPRASQKISGCVSEYR